MGFHMIDIIYAALSILAQTEKTTFSCKDNCTLMNHTGRWTYSALRYFFSQNPKICIYACICFQLVCAVKSLWSAFSQDWQKLVIVYVLKHTIDIVQKGLSAHYCNVLCRRETLEIHNSWALVKKIQKWGLTLAQFFSCEAAALHSIIWLTDSLTDWLTHSLTVL